MSSHTFYQILVILLLLSLQKLLAIKSLELLSLRCHHNTNYIEDFNISCVENRISCELQTKVKIPAGVKFHIDLERGLSSSGAFNTFFKYDIDFCRVIGSNRNNLFKRWVLSLDKHGQMPSRCPWPVGQYYLRDWQLSGDLIPPFVVPGHYKSKVMSYLGSIGTKSFVLLIDCEVISKMI